MMNGNFATRRGDLTRDARRRGSTLILAVVVVVMLVMLGAGFMQMARMDRRTTSVVETTADTDNGSIIRYLARILASDVVDESGDFFASGIEPYDYPWTDAAATPWKVKDRYAPVVVPGPQDDAARAPRNTAAVADAAGTTAGAQGNTNDDVWLASTAPDFTAGTWPHISNIMGVFLDMNPANFVDGPAGTGTEFYPRQFLSTKAYAAFPANTFYSGDTDVSFADMQADTNNFVFADADGDGINDSRWTWAPLPSDLGRSFIMAVRIVDNSALANTGVWTKQSTAAAVADQPRFLWPGELNLNLQGAALSGASFINDLAAERGLDTPTAATPFATADGRYWNWLGASRMYGDINALTDGPAWLHMNNEVMANPVPVDFKTFEANDGSEAELRWRNGLNRDEDNLAPADPDAPIENANGAAGGGDWRGAEVFTTAAAAGYSNQNFFDNSGAKKEFRKHFTTLSGAAAYGQTSLNAGSNAVGQTLFDSLSNGTYPNVARWGGNNGLAEQFAAVVADWRDIDTPDTLAPWDETLDNPRLTKVGNAYGMEYLPFVSVAYVQSQYNGTDTGADTAWAKTGEQVVIEFVNPWPWEVALPEVEVQFDGTSIGNLRAILGKTTMIANEVFHATFTVGGAAGTDYAPAATTTDITAEAAANWPAGGGTPTGGTVLLELLAPVANDTPVVYQRLQVGLPGQSFTQVGGAPSTSPAYLQMASVGTGNGLNALTVREADMPPGVIGGGNPQALGDPSATVSFGTPSKSAGFDNIIADAEDAGGSPVAGDEPFLIGNEGRILRAGEIFRMVLWGPTTTQTVADVWAAAQAVSGTGQIKDLMLDFAANTTPLTPVSGSIDVAWGPYLLSRFTTLSPSNDGQDNNGDGDADDDRENFVPGLLNINTATQAMIEAAVPLPPAQATTLANLIVAARRETPAPVRDANYTARTDPGLAFLGEIGASLYGIGNTSAMGVTDFQEYEDIAGIVPGTPDGYSDREKDIIGYSYLNQVLSVRSDVYTAYVLVRAYPATDFTNAGTNTPLDEYRLVVTFDRSGLTEDANTPRVVSVAVYKN